MELKDKVIVITGAASGIGSALARRFAAESPKGLVLADVDEAPLAEVAAELSALPVRTDVAREADVQRLVTQAESSFGPVDLFCSNAGIACPGGPEVSDADWRRILDINVMAHVYAARALLPAMLERKCGYFLNTASAAGLLSQVGSAPYSVTKHAAVAFAEWLSITYGDRGIVVSCLCPQGVKTPMLKTASGTPHFLEAGALEPEQVAEAAVDGIRREAFLILPHPEVREYMQRKAADYDRWLRGMRKLQERVRQSFA
jgi:NAD(P)-dependent dehydrogenase (short-subunit alcohol dehydrogenase family)